MFHRRTKAEKAREAAAERAARAAHTLEKARTETAKAGAKAAAGTSALGVAVLGALKEAMDHKVVPAATTARDRAVSSLDHGIDAAVPRAQQAVGHVGPRVDHARDVIVDDVLPKLQELLGQLQHSKDDVLTKKKGAVAVVTGVPKKRKRKGGGLLLLGLLAAAGAGVAYYLNEQKRHPKTDPWATEHHVGGAPGVDTQVRSQLSAEGAGTTTGMVGTTAGTAAAGNEPRMLGSEEIDELADDSPTAADEAEIPGAHTERATGFGTDFAGAHAQDGREATGIEPADANERRA